MSLVLLLGVLHLSYSLIELLSLAVHLAPVVLLVVFPTSPDKYINAFDSKVFLYDSGIRA